jgi:FMN phosphatase YigB (HAD superfamily)
LDPDELEEVLQIYMQPIYDASYVVDGMEDLLDWLKSWGIRLGLINNYKYASGMRGLLHVTGLEKRFDPIIISSEIGWKKPAIQVYEHATSLMKLPPQSCVLVANEEEKDLWQASQLGFRTVLFTPVERLPDDQDLLHDKDIANMLRTRMSGDVEFFANSLDDLRMLLRSLVAD